MKNPAPLFVVIAFIAAPFTLQPPSVAPVKAQTVAQAHPSYVLKRISSRAVHHSWAASPRLRFWESTSGNWSGYAVPLETSKTKDTFSEAQGTWTIPAVTGLLSATYSSLWVGLDGYSSGSVEQIGTEQDWTGEADSNYVWFEMYPNYAYEIVGFPVKPGDSFSAKVQYLGQGTLREGRRTQVVSIFQLSITNTTENVSFTVPTSYTYTASAARSSAEWVLEAPSDDEYLPLADFGEAYFSDCEAASVHSSGKLVPISSWIPDPLTMIDPEGGAATPSALSSNGEAFSVTYTGN